jgi:hypothetical protein
MNIISIMSPLWYGFINYMTILISYPLVEIYIMYNYDKFENYDRKRKNYIIKNFIKSLILKYISISTIPLIPILIFNMGNITKCLHFLGFLYTAGDTIALTKDINMSLSTKIHHSITTVLCWLNTMINWSDPHSIAKMMALYTILSCYSYDVNNCLGMRFLISDVEYQKLKKRAYRIYLSCCTSNWFIHIIYLAYHIKNLEIVVVSYFLVISLVIYDDIVLLNWLQN